MTPTEDKYLNTEMVVKLIHEGCSIEELGKKVKLPPLSHCLNEMMNRKNVSVEITAELAGLNKTSLYRIMKKEMNPSRNILIRLALVLDMSFDETQVLLKSGNCAALSGNRKRDLYLIAGIEKHSSIDEISELLRKQGFPDLYSKG